MLAYVSRFQYLYDGDDGSAAILLGVIVLMASVSVSVLIGGGGGLSIMVGAKVGFVEVRKVRFDWSSDWDWKKNRVEVLIGGEVALA